jgi:signal transduction histidine kinase
MKLWKKYTSSIKKTILLSSNQDGNIKFWRDDMFSNTVIFIIPFCVITIIPSIIWAYDLGYFGLTVIDVLCVLIMIALGFKKDINIETRKTVFLVTMYLLSFILIYYVGLNSTLYLLATCFLAVFIYSFKNKFTPAFINLFISILYIFLYHYDLIGIHNNRFEQNEVFAVFSTLTFLSFFVCALIPELFNQLNDSFQKTLLHTKKIERQNNLLKEITWIQSHIVRTPLSRILSIVTLLKEGDNPEEEKKFLLDNLQISSEELDAIIKDIVEKSENVQELEHDLLTTIKKD